MRFAGSKGRTRAWRDRLTGVGLTDDVPPARPWAKSRYRKTETRCVFVAGWLGFSSLTFLRCSSRPRTLREGRVGLEVGDVRLHAGGSWTSLCTGRSTSRIETCRGRRGERPSAMPVSDLLTRSSPPFMRTTFRDRVGGLVESSCYRRRMPFVSCSILLRVVCAWLASWTLPRLPSRLRLRLLLDLPLAIPHDHACSLYDGNGDTDDCMEYRWGGTA